MSNKIYEYRGGKIVVTYDVERCIHARECVLGMPAVFDPDRRPWVDPDAGDADALAGVVARCPTGALHFARTDNGPAEAVPERNAIALVADGPLYASGDIEIIRPGEDPPLKDMRVAFCRCGASTNKPFCDGSHDEAGFRDPGRPEAGRTEVETAIGAGPLRVAPAANGPLVVSGPVEILGADGAPCFRREKTALCRCGSSRNKPFCDGSHKRVGFAAA
jgi:CDGSH-type Zn-finger protein/uncharacterized Fe-S cluster protein YjdI